MKQGEISDLVGRLPTSEIIELLRTHKVNSGGVYKITNIPKARQRTIVRWLSVRGELLSLIYFIYSYYINIELNKVDVMTINILTD